MPESNETAKKKILVIDDEPHVVTYIKTLLEDNGFDTATAANGREGMEVAKEYKPDLVCLDITMPEQSGISFYRDLRDDPQLAKVPVLVVTAVTTCTCEGTSSMNTPPDRYSAIFASSAFGPCA